MFGPKARRRHQLRYGGFQRGVVVVDSSPVKVADKRVEDLTPEEINDMDFDG